MRCYVMADPVDPRADHVVEQPATDRPMPGLEPQVERPISRLRPVFVIALVATTAFALGVIAWDRWLHSPQPVRLVEPASAALRGCTSLEVEQVIRASSMTDIERVTCLAVAGKIGRARDLLGTMNGVMRARTIAQVFNVAHPIADRGDDASAGPIMALVVEFWPDNYMAVFHAGMAEFALGHDGAAQRQLGRFLAMYLARDVWRARAEQALAAIAAHSDLAHRQAHFSE